MKSLRDRLYEKVDFDQIGAGCWIWTGGTNGKGYGYIRESGSGSRMSPAYRVMYEMHIGPIPDDLCLDHLCCTPRCVNPSHLEPVTKGENSRRGKALIRYCAKGHEFTPENTGRDGSKRYCRECHKAHYRRWYAERGGREKRALERAA